MAHFPVLLHLAVAGYALYPGRDSGGLDISFEPGLTMVMGANGLGKTTLITMIRDTMSGPTELGGRDARRLGNRVPESSNMSPTRRRTFARRVSDGAIGAHVELRFALGDSLIQVRRALADLTITSLEINGERRDPSESQYQAAVVEAAAVGAFAEWLLMLELLVFFFEDRRALVWDQSAQLQVLRLLFLESDLSREWVERYKRVLSLDSLVRNLRYTLNVQTKALEVGLRKAASAGGARETIASLQAIQAGEQSQLDDLEERLEEALKERERSRLQALRGQQELEDAMRALEHAQLMEISSAFPSINETAKYLLGQLVSERACLVCGTETDSLSATVARRLARKRCPVCASVMDADGATVASFGVSITQLTAQVDQAKIAADSAAGARISAEHECKELIARNAALNASITRRASEISELIKTLPPGEQVLEGYQQEHRRYSALLAQNQEELNEERAEFGRLQETANMTIATKVAAVQGAFERYARGFLLEDCRLAWSPYRDSVGQTGPSIELPSFELDMSGASFESPVRRSGPEAVSESQREFIDLAFKMALIEVGSSGVGTLLIDAPESSLDAVFVGRAADVLTKFGVNTPSNRLIVTSNLIDGDLVPHLLSKADVREASGLDGRVVDLLDLAAPTAAVAQNRAEYEQVRQDVFARARELAARADGV